MTRLPAPHRSPAHLVNEFLAARFPEPPLVLGADRYRTLLAGLPEHGIAGGAVYDALIAATATDAGATLLTIDRRGAQTYERIGAAVRFVV